MSNEKNPLPMKPIAILALLAIIAFATLFFMPAAKAQAAPLRALDMWYSEFDLPDWFDSRVPFELPPEETVASQIA